MVYDPRIHHRRSIRLRGYDYAGGGVYFITICTQDKIPQFGSVVDGEMILNDPGRLMEKTWDDLLLRFRTLVLDTFQVMPNHLHGVFVLPGPGLHPALAEATGAPIIQPSPENYVGRTYGNDPDIQYSATAGVRAGLALPTVMGADRTQGRASPPRTRRTCMGDVVGTFKSISTIAVNRLLSRTGTRLLHENFYEHIVRDVDELEKIRDYIIHNPQRWMDDPNNPESPAYMDR